MVAGGTRTPPDAALHGGEERNAGDEHEAAADDAASPSGFWAASWIWIRQTFGDMYFRTDITWLQLGIRKRSANPYSELQQIMTKLLNSLC